MRLASVLATAAIVVSCGSGIAQAQIKKTVPAEFPPASYTGRQYVDSTGCVFIRAGVDGAVNWVPRVSRGRKQICGMQPTLSGNQIAAARAPRATAPVTQPAPAPATTTVARKPAPAPAATPLYRSAPPPKPAATTPDPVPVTAPVAKPEPAPKPRRVVVANCANLSPQSQQYINSTNRYTIRCGPQSAPHVTERATAGPNATVYNPGTPTGVTSYRTGSYAAPGYVTATTRVAPKHVYANQKASTEGVYVPEGYVSVWEDDRLNTRRAHQTFAGKAQMEQRWTKTTPRQLKQPAVGPVVTEADVVTRSAVSTPMVMSFAQQGAPQAKAAPKPAATMAATPKVETRAASHRYVELGNFSDPAHAKRTAQKLANSGLPARMGKVTHKGKTYTLVMAGPFTTQSALDSGLARVRGMGFAQASLRR
ncbi:SPOR domain-containing protein [Roseovarius sp.]|uniref:SPOR domain-containing protein n=1 Tax=Roseovarius sp. TaxID=1486281 RepID=UPI002610BF7D|nr:SPOR domain-containing protein [Roseovarius sp.]MDM8168648.1 SPOR domain-containing protein [Roseovarius sp.]